jgi:hypothetical protein
MSKSVQEIANLLYGTTYSSVEEIFREVYLAGYGGNTIRVTSGQSIQDAITVAVAKGMTALNPYTILVYPGTHAEQVTLAPGAHVIGVDRKSCIITAANDVVTMSANSTLENMTVKTAALTDGASGSTGVTATANSLSGIVVKDCDITGCQWAFEGAAEISARIEGCYLESPNPIYWGLNNALIANNTADYTGEAVSCFGFMDAIDGLENTTVIGNRVYMKGVNAPADKYWLRFSGNNNRFIGNEALMDGVDRGWWIVGGGSDAGINYFSGNRVGLIGRDQWTVYNWYIEGAPLNDFADIVSLGNHVYSLPDSGALTAQYGLFLTDVVANGLNWTLDPPSIECAASTVFTFDGKNGVFSNLTNCDLTLL